MADSPAPRALYLLDGMQLAYRAYFALARNPIRTSKGVNTSALHGFAQVIEDIRQRRNASHLAVVWDTSAPTFRHERYPDYKAHRDEMPDDLRDAIPQIKRWVEALNLPTLQADGWEADDIIATLAAQAEAEGCEMTWMVTSDKDFGQLVTERIHILRPGRQGALEEEWGPATVCERWGIARPAQVIDMLGLMGDASDNIPGVPGIGEKTAAKLLAEHDSLTGVLQAAKDGQIKGKNGERLVEFADQALLSHELATIIAEAPVRLDWAKLSVGEPEREALAELCREFEFNTLGKRLLGDDFHAGRGHSAVTKTSPSANTGRKKNSQADADLFASPQETTAAATSEDFPASDATDGAQPSLDLADDASRRFDPGAVDYRSITELADLKTLLGKLEDSPQIAFDTETDGLNPRHARLLGLSFCAQPGSAQFIILPAADGPERSRFLEALGDFLRTYPGTLIAHNAKFDLAVLATHGIEPKAQIFDTLLAAGLLDISQRRGMDFLAESRLGYRPISYAELTGSAKVAEQVLLTELIASEPKRVSDYACEDADITRQLAQLLEPELKQTGRLSELLAEVEAPLTPVLVAMEAEGIRLDPEALDEVRDELTRRIASLETEIEALAGSRINLASPKQLGELLFDQLRLQEKPKKTKTGQYVTNEQVLSQLAAQHDIAARILSWREANKLKNTYVDPLPQAVDPADGRIHTSYQQLAATTGRLASTDPNLQNIPVRSELGRLVRQAFVPRDENFRLLSCDYSQVELRIMAHLSGDSAMIEAFKVGEDIHNATAARVFGVEPQAVLPEMRRAAKMVNFGIIYGISAFGLSQRLGCSRSEASAIIEGYWKSYPQVREFMSQVVEAARERGFGETILGRRCPMPDLRSRNQAVRGNAERFAINMPIQGSAADLIKKAMVEVHHLLQSQIRRSKLLLQVHDELVFDLHNDEAEALIPQLVQTMEQALTLSVPLLVDHGLGQNWLEAH